MRAVAGRGLRLARISTAEAENRPIESQFDLEAGLDRRCLPKPWPSPSKAWYSTGSGDHSLGLSRRHHLVVEPLEEDDRSVQPVGARNMARPKTHCGCENSAFIGHSALSASGALTRYRFHLPERSETTNRLPSGDHSGCASDSPMPRRRAAAQRVHRLRRCRRATVRCRRTASKDGSTPARPAACHRATGAARRRNQCAVKTAACFRPPRARR
jgi:hypothetical protein